MTNGKQKRMREQLKAIEEENEEIRKKRLERDMESAKALSESPEANQHFGREIRRAGQSGVPRSVIYSQKMKVPRGRR